MVLLMMEDLMNKLKVNIWNREFELDVIYQVFSGQDVIDNQVLTASKISTVDFSESKKAVESFIKENYSDDLGLSEVDNIFRYVMPKRIFIPKEKETRVFAIMCNFKFDIEHGLAVVFKNEKFKEVGPQDIIL